MFVLFCLYGRLPEGRKWVSHKGFCLTSGNRTNVPTSLGRVNPNTAAAEIRTRRLARHQAATRTQADWNSVCPRRNPGVRTAPGQIPGIVQTLCRPFQAFRWFLMHNLSSNSTVPVACTPNLIRNMSFTRNPVSILPSTLLLWKDTCQRNVWVSSTAFGESSSLRHSSILS